jgi:hypothetical protein
MTDSEMDKITAGDAGRGHNLPKLRDFARIAEDRQAIILRHSHDQGKKSVVVQ